MVSVSGFSRALLDGIGGILSEKQQKYLTIINQNSKDLSYDLEKLFTLFKVESKKVEYNFKKFDLIKFDIFNVGDIVDVQGTTKGRGYTGAIKL